MIDMPAQSVISGPPLGLLFHSGELELDALQSALTADGVERRGAAQLFDHNRVEETPSVLLVDHSLLASAHRIRVLPSHVVVVAADAAAERELGSSAAL
jgi:hypothetical protein